MCVKRFLLLLLVPVCLLAGCAENDVLNRMMSLRENLLAGNGCSFDVQVTADYEDQLFTFSMQCTADPEGTVNFTITAPETLAGIGGQISAKEGHLEFEDKVLVFDLLTNGIATPVSAPWLLVRTLLGGYISAGGADGELYLFQIDDSYEEDPLRLDIWIDENNIPVAADIIWDGRRVVALTIENFRLV